MHFSRYFKRVLLVLLGPSFYNSQVQFPMEITPISPAITDDPRFRFFRDCIGAVDGTHICAFTAPWRPAPYAQSERLSITKLSIRLRLRLPIHTHQMGWLNYGRQSMEWHTYPGLANATGKVPSSRYRVWDIGRPSSSISWGLVSSQGVAPGKSKVCFILPVD